MLNLVPIEPMYYNPEKITNLSSVVAPMYYDIEPAAQSRYYAENPMNVIRLENGLTFPTDDLTRNRPARAAQYLNKWRADNIVLSTKRPWFFIYQQEFVMQDQPRVKTGLICGLRCEDLISHQVVPVSDQQDDDVLDRLQTLRATGSYFGTPLLGFRDSGESINHTLLQMVQGRYPDIQFLDEFQVLNKVWSVRGTQDLAPIAALMSSHPLYILAGRELFDAAQRYCSETDHILIPATLVSTDSDHLVPLPWHRAVQVDISSKGILKLLAQTYVLEEFGGIEDLAGFHNIGTPPGSAPPLGLIVENRVVLATEKKPPAGLLFPDPNRLINTLTQPQNGKSDSAQVFYSRIGEHILQQVTKGKYAMGLIMPPPTMANLLSQADANITVPHHSIWWHPRQLAGVVMYQLQSNPG